jgi:hypothetical protein
MPRLVTLAIGAVIVVAGIGGLIMLFQSRDDAGIQHAAQGPGRLEPDGGFAHDARAQAGATSGPHRPEPVTADERRLTPDQIVHALELGNVVVTYPGAVPPRPLRTLQADLTGRFDAELAATGQAVILARGDGYEGLAWRRRVKVDGPADPALRNFTEHWLGLGAPGR